MSNTVSGEEAYLLGCLFGRGSIEAAKTKNYYLIFRIPFREYSPVAVEMIKVLQNEPKGLTANEILEIPKVKVHQVTNVGLLLNKLKRWHPPRKFVKKPLLKKEKDRWKINDLKLANEFLKWQQIYLERETVGIKDYVLKHLRETTTFLATSPDYSEEISEFGIVNHIIRCEITPHTFETLKSKYGLEEGDIYRYARIPKTIFDFPKEALEEFVRGLADTIATIDVWHIPRVQFSIINDNYGLPVDLCNILQQRLKIPVYYIGWAGKYAKRGGRDHLVKVWTVHFDEPLFSRPLFYNNRKEEEFLYHLAVAKEKLTSLKKKPTWLAPCPLYRKKRGYMKTCVQYGCKQLPKGLIEFTSEAEN
jgi:hypothetical protein